MNNHSKKVQKTASRLLWTHLNF